MGTPNSISADEALARFLVDGIEPTVDQLVAYGIDSRLLENRFSKLKPYLPYLEGFEPMTSIRFENSLVRLAWQRNVEADPALENTWVLRFDDSIRQSIFRLRPVGSGNFPKVDVCLVKSGGWIVIVDSWQYQSGIHFHFLDTIHEVAEYLDLLQKDTYELWTKVYPSLMYWPVESVRTNKGRQTVAATKLILMAHLATILDRSNKQKQSRLSVHVGVLDEFRKAEARNFLEVGIRY